MGARRNQQLFQLRSSNSYKVTQRELCCKCGGGTGLWNSGLSVAPGYDWLKWKLLDNYVRGLLISSCNRDLFALWVVATIAGDWFYVDWWPCSRPWGESHFISAPLLIVGHWKKSNALSKGLFCCIIQSCFSLCIFELFMFVSALSYFYIAGF